MQNKLTYTLSPLFLVALIAVWISHAINVFTPEVGFDAVWYHLPVAASIIEAGKLVYLSDMYQSLNPLFSDLFFTAGFAVAGELGAKIVAYLFGLSLVGVTYVVSRQILTRHWSLIVALVISTFQVVAWQSASFYVDVAKAFWEITMIYYLFKWQDDQRVWQIAIVGLLLSASLATKMFSILLIPLLVIVVLWQSRQRIRDLIIFLGATLPIALPFYLRSYYYTGHWLFAIQEHLSRLGQIGGGASVWQHFWVRTLALPSLPWEVLIARDYTSILLLLLLPLIFIAKSKFAQLSTTVKQRLFLLMGFTGWQLVIWWYVPPLSTRYALSGFITWMILTGWLMQLTVSLQPQYRKPLLIAVFIAVFINMVPRVWVNYRSLRYILGMQTKTEYIYQFYDGSIDHHLQKWHQL